MNKVPEIPMIHDRWRSLWRRLGAATTAEETLDELLEAYASPGRYYHDIAHIQDCLSLLDHYTSLATHPDEVELAIWFHDAIYDTTGNDNELQSARWAVSVIGRQSPDSQVAERVSRLILATRHSGEVSSGDEELMVDIDLSILGGEEDRFRRYEENIRKEYAWVAQELFRERRAAILRGFLERERIYHLDEFRERFEARARVNLEWAIGRLVKGEG